MVLVVGMVLIWSLSSQLQTGATPVSFSEFIQWVDTGQVNRVELTGNEIIGTMSSGDQFRTHAPLQYDGLANMLLERDVVVEAREAAASPWATLLYPWAPILLIIGFLSLPCGGSRAAATRRCRSARTGPSCHRASRRRWVYPGFPTLFWGLSGFFVNDLMGKALWSSWKTRSVFQGAVGAFCASTAPSASTGPICMRQDRRVLGLQSTRE